MDLKIFDHFSHFAQALPTKNQTVRTTAKIFFEHFAIMAVRPVCTVIILMELSLKSCARRIILKSLELRTPLPSPGERITRAFQPDILEAEFEDICPTLVHAYNLTRHETSGPSAHFLMFWRHSWLAIDAFLGIESDPSSSKSSHAEYINNLKSRLILLIMWLHVQSLRRQSKRHKRRYYLMTS